MMEPAVGFGEGTGSVGAIFGNFFTDGNAGDAEIRAGAVIALHENAYRKGASF